MADAAVAPLPPAMDPTARKRRTKSGKSQKSNKKRKSIPMASKKTKKPSQKMLKLFRKRARDYHSDEEEDLADAGDEENLDESSGEEEEHEELDAGDEDEFSGSEDDGDGAQLGLTRFTEGCRAFKMAFTKIMKKHLSNDPLGPILSANKKLVAEKLAEEVAEQKVKGETKKEKHLAGEKGHVAPANILDPKEKFLISVATKGVVKLFNAVNKAQNPQKGLNPSKTKDAKELAKRRKQAFLSEIQKSSTYDNSSKSNSTKFSKSTNKEDNEESGWAPLRDSYMLTSSKLKDWDKMADPAPVDEPESRHMDSSSDEE